MLDMIHDKNRWDSPLLLEVRLQVPTGVSDCTCKELTEPGADWIKDTPPGLIKIKKHSP